MKIISLQLANFRQFYGKTPIINFSYGKKNTTVIHGNNGAGKTAILNAFTWVFYEKFTGAFSEPQSLVNKKAIQEVEEGASVECFVEVIFEHDYKTYQLKRKCFGSRNKQNQIQITTPQLFMMITGDDGRWQHPLQQPKDIIEKILPQSLHGYFFFDGEHIDHLFRSQERQKIAEDTKELIGVKVLERAISHLKNAKKHFHEELQSLGDIQIKSLLKEREKQCNLKEKLKNDFELLKERLAKLQAEKENISQQMLEVSGIENLQRLKQKLLQREKELRITLVDTQQSIKKEISSKSYLVFLSKTFTEFQEIVNRMREKGELPIGIKKEFIEQLLKQNRCLCGNQLIPNSISYQEVEKLLQKTGSSELEEILIRLESSVSNLLELRENFWNNINEYQDIINNCRLDLNQIENELDNLNEQLRKYPDKNIQQMQKQLDNIENHIRQVILNQGEINLQLDNLEEELSKLEKQIIKQEIKAEKENLIKRRIEATQKAIDCILEVKKRLENQFRLTLEKRLQEIFASISFTPYQPLLNENYELNLVENTLGIPLPVAASTGENQILSLSFIGAIIDMVRKWSKESRLVNLNSSNFPIVMDSPFGSLDEVYRRQVAKIIPKLANQLIVLVTKTQWRNEVETEMNSYINKQYVLTYLSSKDDCQEDVIILNNQEYPLVKRSENQFEYTEIVEVI
ncbi:AAA family ATPase [Cyanobacterium aponinum FACHB-4101]|uniref:AAA family ATPase n=1 Tax=Cyanobacterium aponinum TaxID=379064 RepID=UPI0016812719|nr:AAA family ATPase [Cyanobacterium aponinum]MBD2394062.1 AAA family ATPase [Cyanobacterium aponinum FACHB-4101]